MNKGEYVDEIVWVSLSSIKDVWNPFSKLIWNDLKNPISINEIMDCIINNKIASEYLDPEDLERQSRDYHIRRIAHFVINGWEEPIQIDVRTSIPEINEFKIYDGKHRIIAAIFRLDSFIPAILTGKIKEEEKANQYLEQFRYKF